mgnify:FL=1
MVRRKESAEIGNNGKLDFGDAQEEALVCQSGANQFIDLLKNDDSVSQGTLAGVKNRRLEKPHQSDYFKPGLLFRVKG